MAKVNTVLGPISADQLGVTLIHEHLNDVYPGWECDAMAKNLDRRQIADICVKKLEKARALGLVSFVDPAAADMSRDVELTKEVSNRTGINIVLATGMICERIGKSGYWKTRSRWFDATTEMYESFMKEITQGIGNSGVKAGVIKVAISVSITPYDEMILRAGARVQKETGLPLIAHTEDGAMSLETADILASEGADPKRTVIAHICCTADMKYLAAVLAKGVYLGFDRMGDAGPIPVSLKTACLIGLLGIGHADRILLSSDHVGYMQGRPWPWDIPGHPLTPMFANWSYSNIFQNIVPALKNAGVTDEKINTMLVDNPRRLFAGD